MKRRTGARVRQSFLDFFAGKDHRIVPSAPLIPVGDPTLLLTNKAFLSCAGLALEDGLGRSLDFIYQTVGRWTALTRVTDQGGRQIDLMHEAEGAANEDEWTLRSVSDPLNQTTTFHYAPVGSFIPFLNQITCVEWPQGNTPYYAIIEYLTVEVCYEPQQSSDRRPRHAHRGCPLPPGPSGLP